MYVYVLKMMSLDIGYKGVDRPLGIKRAPDTLLMEEIKQFYSSKSGDSKFLLTKQPASEAYFPKRITAT